MLHIQKRLLPLICLLILCFPAFPQSIIKSAAPEVSIKKGYVKAGEVNMYYEIHGKGEPLVLLHGGFSATGTSFGTLLPELARDRQVISLELQGHGRTADIDRPITYEALSGDVYEALKKLGIEKADFLGYSLGAATAMNLYFGHPEVVGKMILISVSYKTSGIYPEVWSGLEKMTPEVFDSSPFKKEYDSIAPHPEHFPALVAKMKILDSTPYDFREERMKTIKVPTMLIIGDADIVKPEHGVEILRLLGGGVIGDLAGVPSVRLAVLPGTSHVGVMHRPDLLLPMIQRFLQEKINVK